MVLDLILKLVDRLIDLAKKHEEVNRAMFVDFVQPAFQTFEGVHADYIDSLARYSARLADTTLPMDLSHPVFRDIELDSLKSGHLRTKLKDLRPTNAPPKLKDFLSAIDNYLRGITASGARAELIDKLALAHGMGMDIDDLTQGLAAINDPGDQTLEIVFPAPRFHAFMNVGQSGLVLPIYSDPMREALREVLVGFDAPKDLADDEERDLMRESVSYALFDKDDRRRQLCSQAVRASMLHFQNSYVFVSSTYSALRSELLSPM